MYAHSILMHLAQHVHDEGLQFVHCTAHLLHEKSFWKMVILIAAVVAVAAWLVVMGPESTLLNVPIY